MEGEKTFAMEGPMSFKPYRLREHGVSCTCKGLEGQVQGCPQRRLITVWGPGRGSYLVRGETGEVRRSEKVRGLGGHIKGSRLHPECVGNLWRI